jgi:hypothetical protein
MAKKSEQASVADWLDSDGDSVRSQPESATNQEQIDDWREMSTLGVAHDAGALVVLTPDRRQGFTCSWRESRQFVPGADGRGGRFATIGFWSLGRSGGQRIGWEPVGWRPYEEERPYAPKP